MKSVNPMFLVVYGHHAYARPDKMYLILSRVDISLPEHFVAVKIVRATYSYGQALEAAALPIDHYDAKQASLTLL